MLIVLASCLAGTHFNYCMLLTFDVDNKDYASQNWHV